MHTFKAPNGTVFNFNSDMSGLGTIAYREDYSVVAPGADMLAFQAHLLESDEIKRALLADELRASNRERIEFIRRAYLARLGTVKSVPDYSVYDPAKGEHHHGRDALRYLAEQDWEAVREL